MASDNRITVPLDGGLQFGSFMSEEPRILYMDGLVAMDGIIREAGVLNNVVSTYGGALGATTKLLEAKYVPVPGDAGYYVATDRRLLFSSAGGAWQDYSLGAADYAAAATSWQYLLFGSRIIATCKENPVQSRVAGFAFSNLATSPEKPSGKCICTSYAHCFLADIVEAGVSYPSRVWWSARNNAAIWTPGTDRAGYIDIIGGGSTIVAMFGFFDYVIIIKDAGVYRLNYTGGPTTFQLQQIAGDTFGGRSDSFLSAGTIGRDIFYTSARGPAVIRNGEVAQLLEPALASPVSAMIGQGISGVTGEQALSLLAGTDSGVRFCPIGQSASWMTASYSDVRSGAVGTNRRIISYDPTSGKWASTIVYSIANGAASSTAPTALAETTIAPVAIPASTTYPLASFRELAFVTYTAAGSLRLRKSVPLATAGTCSRAPIVVKTSRVALAGLARAMVHGVIWEGDTFGGQDASSLAPKPTVTIRAARKLSQWSNTASESTAGIVERTATAQELPGSIMSGPGWPFEAQSVVVTFSLPAPETPSTSPETVVRSLGNLHILLSPDSEL